MDKLPFLAKLLTNIQFESVANFQLQAMECPLIFYTDLDRSLCKTLEETLLMCVEPSAKTL